MDVNARSKPGWCLWTAGAEALSNIGTQVEPEDVKRGALATMEEKPYHFGNLWGPSESRTRKHGKHETFDFADYIRGVRQDSEHASLLELEAVSMCQDATIEVYVAYP